MSSRDPRQPTTRRKKGLVLWGSFLQKSAAAATAVCERMNTGWRSWRNLAGKYSKCPPTGVKNPSAVLGDWDFFLGNWLAWKVCGERFWSVTLKWAENVPINNALYEESAPRWKGFAFGVDGDQSRYLRNVWIFALNFGLRMQCCRCRGKV